MSSGEIRKKFLKFFEANGHTIVPSSSLVPDDPSVLLTTAGMQQFKKYYTGEADPIKDFGSKNTASCQKSFRTSDIDEVGDERHLTFFEMLGNFSFDGYFKKEAITYAHEFITKEMGLRIAYVTIFEGKESIGVPKDAESRDIWKSLDPNLEVREEGMDDVFWGPTGSSGPCGPTTEIYCTNAAGQDIEIWNIVFNQYLYPGSREELNAGASGKKLEPLKTPGVDTGMGLERLAMVVQGTKTIFETDLFKDAFKRDSSGASARIILDHIRGAIFLIADGVRPSNKGAGYILRRLMRRAIFHVRKMTAEDEGGGFSLSESEIKMIVGNGIGFYKNAYRELETNEETIIAVFGEEYKRFAKALSDGIRELGRMHPSNKWGGRISGEDAFHLYQSFGLPREVIKDVCAERGVDFDDVGFQKELAKHQEVSRAGQEKKFGGHGLILDTGELRAANEDELKKVTRLHTATHMLQQALRDVLGPEVHQAGSDITALRTRFDFTFSRKLTPEEIARVEQIVNEKIKEDLPMQKVVLPKAEAEKTGALYFFKEKYPDPVNVYFIGHSLEAAWSKEFCGGPHVGHAGEIGVFKIAKEEGVGGGVRRIRGVIEP